SSTFAPSTVSVSSSSGPRVVGPSIPSRPPLTFSPPGFRESLSYGSSEISDILTAVPVRPDAHSRDVGGCFPTLDAARASPEAQVDGVERGDYRAGGA